MYDDYLVVIIIVIGAIVVFMLKLELISSTIFGFALYALSIEFEFVLCHSYLKATVL